MKRILALALALTCQGFGLSDSTVGASRRFLLAASANDGGPGKARLRFAHQDAHGMANVMHSLGGVDPQDAVILQEPDTAKFLSALREVSERMARERQGGSRMELVLYYSGHSDESGLLLGGQTLPYLVLRRALEGSGADVRLAVLDACASGAALRAKGGTRHQAFRIEGAEGLRGQAFLTSSRAEESSQESDRLKGSVFTRAFLTGLRGAADLDHDKKVTLQEAYRFAYEQTLEWTASTSAGPQHPEFQLDLSGSGEVVLTDLSRAQSQLEIGPEISGRILISDSTGLAVADLSKKPGQNLSLGLPSGTYRIQTSDSTTRRVSRSTLASGARTQLSAQVSDSVGPLPPRWADTIQPPMAELVDVPFHFAIAPDWKEFKLPVKAALQDTVPPSRARYHLGIDLLEGEPAEVNGAHLALGISRVSRDVRGAQVALGLSRTGGKVRGSQIALGYSRITDSLNGMQFGALAVMDGPYRGIQVAPGMAIARVGGEGAQVAAGVVATLGASRGVQFAPVCFHNGRLDGIQFCSVSLGNDTLHGAQFSSLNMVNSHVRGVQMGAFNLSRSLRGAQGGAFNVSGSTYGAQAGVGNFSGSLRGAQVSLVNVGGEVSGTQVGLVNIARRISGAQVGLVNLADSSWGTAIGLVNLAKNMEAFPIGLVSLGMNMKPGLEFHGTETGLFGVGLRLSNRHFHFGLLATVPKDDIERLLGCGASIGSQWKPGGVDLELEISNISLVEDGDFDHTAHLNRLSFTAGFDLDGLKVFGGPTWNILNPPTGEADRYMTPPGRYHWDANGDIRMWPGFVAGIRL